MDPLPITKEQLRSVVLEALPQANQVASLYPVVAGLAAKRFLDNPPPTNASTIGPRHVSTGYLTTELHLANTDKTRVLEILWDLIVEGIIRPFQDDSNKWPFYRITDVGKEFLKGLPVSPFDPDGYLTRIKSDIPNVDDVIIAYLTESLRTFRIGCYLAATVTLGCAAEKAILLLIDSCVAALPSPEDKAFEKKTDDRQIKGKFEEFHKLLISRIRAPLKKARPDVDQLLDVQLNGIFDIIRTQRNAAGHPTGTPISQSDAFGDLYAVEIFLKKVYALMDWLKASKI